MLLPAFRASAANSLYVMEVTGEDNPASGTGELIAYHRPDTPGLRQSVYTRYPCDDAKALCNTLSRALPVRRLMETAHRSR